MIPKSGCRFSEKIMLKQRYPSSAPAQASIQGHPEAVTWGRLSILRPSALSEQHADVPSGRVAGSPRALNAFSGGVCSGLPSKMR
jgi:hypothetical protein